MMAATGMRQELLFSDLLAGIFDLSAELDFVVSGLCLDSRKLKAGDIFLACAGQTVHGLDYVDEVISQGARAVLWETTPELDTIPLNWQESPHGLPIPLIAIPELSNKVGVFADRFYGHPSGAMFVTGFTGTNGKTSCSQYLAQILDMDAPCGVIGTIGAGLYKALNTSSHTTPDALSCHALLADMLEQGAKSVVLEVSSHALEQGRVNGIEFDCAVFTNLSRDHLDYHGDMQAYAAAKAGLFKFAGLQHAVINHDDEFGRELRQAISNELEVLSYGFDTTYGQPDIFADKLTLTASGVGFHVQTPWGTGDVSAQVLGRFNASNLLAVLGVLLAHGMPLATALQGLTMVKPVPGRMECFQQAGQALVVVDYAHTPDALEQVLQALRAHCRGRLWCVFGCGGDRDQGKRPLMGEIAERLADKTILTNDNPRSEQAHDIIEQILDGCKDRQGCTIIEDRAKAIATAIQSASAEDIVLIAGKGHEDYQLIGEQRLEFSDTIEVRKSLGMVS